ncbi:hypothetical protein K2D_00440 [Planctomycetes bacterium K2D]|uniref:Uncharacterized protein n=1 Tax=Botrimarina mediterranea TaxID=2528022 RepID=A0A518K2E3_9BACT|nr:hypothetical protein Spa11_00940 [Botrimarina mediterranea]QDV76466.1 hypothetical protein K2D_00440 [Planctomycetes bacterium K2D]
MNYVGVDLHKKSISVDVMSLLREAGGMLTPNMGMRM